MLVVHWRALNTVGMTLCVLFWPFLLVACSTLQEQAFTFTWHTVKDWFPHLLFWPSCPNWPALDWCSLHVIQTDFMDVHQFYFWIPICTVWRAEEGSNAFTHLVMCRRPLTAAHKHTHTHTFFFFCSPALNLTLVPSLFLSLTPF